MKKLIAISCATALLAGCAGGQSGTIVPASYTAGDDGSQFIDGYEAIKRVDYATAEDELRDVLDRAPNDPYANLAMGYVMQQTGRKTEARALYDIALRDGEDVYPDRHFVLADREYGTRPVEEDSIAEMATRNIASLEEY